MKIKNINRKFLPDKAEAFYVEGDNQYMFQAKELAKLSNERQQPVGVVIVSDGKIISRKFNVNRLKNNFLINLHKKYCIRHLLKLPTGKYYWVCPGCAQKKDHAEYQASKEILKKGNFKKPVDIYMWGHWACCDACCKIMEKIPIGNIYRLKNCEILFDPKESGNIIGKQF